MSESAGKAVFLSYPSQGAAAGRIFEELRATGTNCAPAGNGLESKLVEIWQVVLHRDRVDIHDNFFDLGGHSLQAMQVTARVRTALGVNLPVRWLFDHPTIELLARQLSTAAGATADRGPVPQRDRRTSIPVSFAQQPLWMLAQIHTAVSAYNLPRLLRLDGPLDVSALRRSLAEIVRRHEVLRTTFVSGNDLAEQRIAPAEAVSLPVVDLLSLPEAAREAEARRQAIEEAERPFDLGQGPLLRARLWRSAQATHWLALTVHHSVMDGWSFGILFHELAVLYAAFVEGSPPALRELPVQYADFAAWQRRQLHDATIQSQLAYWRRQLAGAPPQLDLATDFPHPTVQTFRGRRRAAVIAAPAAAQIRAFNRKEGVTLFMTLLAAFQTVLHRHTGQADLVVGAMVADRERAELEGLIGLFLNTLPLRADLSGDPTFREFLRRTRATTLEALSHRHVPWQVLLESVPIARAPRRTPLFQAAFNLLNFEDAPLQLPQVQVTEFFPPAPAALFDLELYARESSSGLRFSLVGNADLFADDTLEELLGHLVTLLAEIAADPDRRLSQLPLFTETQRRQAAAQVRASLPANPFPLFDAADVEQSIPSRFEQQAARHPERIAIGTARQRWTYRDLNAVANHVARTLLTRLGAGPHRIALLHDHDAAMVAAILGVLKAGMTYVPLDPSNPETRLCRIMDDAQTSALLFSRSHCALATSVAPEGVIRIESDAAVDLATAASNPRLALPSDATAYLLYTSGSTGQPKAVTQIHRNVLHFIRVYANALHLTPDDRLTLFPTYGFDAAVMDIFGALLNGASLHLLPVRETNAPEILEFLRAEAITVYHSTPTLYRHLVGSLAPDAVLPHMRLVVLGGEAVMRSDVESHRRHFAPGCLLVNGFGPTECTVAVQYFISHRTPLRGDRVPFGHPVDGTEVLLLDETGAERGIVGEIALRSPHVAPGYWRQQALTREKFPADPAGGPVRIFRTGDLGRRRPDGMLEFLGRKDGQVKIRGFRVELGEIESALCSLPGVREAAVIQRDDLAAGQTLAGYVRLVGGTPWTAASLRQRLRCCLPEHMIPALILVIDEMPRLANGKLDRRALPEPATVRESPPASGGPPMSLLERKLLEIWRRLFALPTIGREDNFFDLGGHSLLATRLATEINGQFGCKLPIAALFQSPTVESLARRLAGKDWAPKWISLVSLQPLGVKPALFLAHGVGGSVYSFLDLAQRLAPNQPVYGLQAVGMDGKSNRHTTIEAMAAHYVEEIRSFQPEGPYYLAGYSAGGVIAFEMAQQFHRLGQRVALLALFDTLANWTIPWTAYGRFMASYLPKRCVLHLRRLWKMPHRGRLDYIRGTWAMLMYWIARNRSKPTVAPAPPPASGQPPQVSGGVDYFVGLARSYRLSPYPGCADVFVSDSAIPGLMSQWIRFVRGGVSFHRIPGTHNQILCPDYLSELAKKLTAALNRAQESEGSLKKPSDQGPPNASSAG